MNQHQIIRGLKARGYEPTLTSKAYVIMTRPVGAEYTGQVIHKDGTLQTLRSVDAARAINNEEINMSTYHTKKQLEALSEKERTALYNERTGSSVARMRNKPKAVEAILASQEQPAEVEQTSEPTLRIVEGAEIQKRRGGFGAVLKAISDGHNTVDTALAEVRRTHKDGYQRIDVQADISRAIKLELIVRA